MGMVGNVLGMTQASNEEQDTGMFMSQKPKARMICYKRLHWFVVEYFQRTLQSYYSGWVRSQSNIHNNKHKANIKNDASHRKRHANKRKMKASARKLHLILIFEMRKSYKMELKFSNHIPVAAAASLPSSLTSMNDLWKTCEM